ncbi:MerC domain-containing protein [soil metagenome]
MLYYSNMAYSPSRWTPASLVDRFGSVGAMLCAVHCALLPLALALLPVLGLGFLASDGFERGFVLFASALATASLIHGYRSHRAYHAFAVLVPGLCALWAGILIPALHESRLAHAVAMSIGGTLVAAAHLVNLRLSQGHCHEQACAHAH